MKTALSLILLLGVRLALGADAPSPAPPTVQTPAKGQPTTAVIDPQAKPAAKAGGGDTNLTPEAVAGARSTLATLGSRLFDLLGGGAGGGGAKSKITGTVVDVEGNPVPNTTVTLFPYSQGETRTDAEGRFTLTLPTTPDQFWRNAAGAGAIIARHLPRDLAATVDIDEATTNATVKLEPGLTLAGRVTDANDKPIAKAEARVIFMSARMGSILGTPSLSDAEGRFEIKGLPSGRRYSVSATAKGYGSDNRTVETPDAATRRIELDPIALALADQRIAGVVVDDEDKPVKGAMLFTFGNGQPNANTQSDAQGRFTFDHVCAGPITIAANNLFGLGSGTAMAAGGDTNITVKLGVNQRGGGIGSAVIKITGTVQDPDGKPAPRVLVSLFPFAQGELLTDAEGRFKLTWDPSQFGGMQINQRVVIARDPARNLAASFDLETDVTNADLKLEPAWTLAGRVVNTNDAAIPGAQAQAMLKADRMTSSYGSPARADAEGRFEIKGLPRGRGFSVQISAPGFGQDNTTAGPPEGDARRVELDPTELLAANQRVAGVVLDADDKPVAGAYVNGSGNKQPNVNGQTDSKGRFSFKQVCAGQLRIFVNSQNGLFGNANVEGGDTNITIRITANRGGGRTPPPSVASLEGKPLPDLAPLGLAVADVPAKRPLLALLIDAEQRPSRRVLKRLTELADTLKQKGLAVVVLQAGAMDGEALEAWKKENALPFPVGVFKGNREKARAAWGAAALPWLILTDADHKVIAEGFAIGELDEKLNPTDK